MHRRFPGLDALRFYAALSVVVYHLDNNPHYWSGTPIVNSLLGIPLLTGADAVTLFFVLSGFLITYLLLDEKARTQAVDVKAFYTRRVLRIWPLYYAVALVGIVVFPLLLGTHQTIPATDQILILSLLANVSWVFGASGILGHLWSIGVEEQFYLVWPWLVKISRHVTLTLVTALVVKLALNTLVWADASTRATPLSLQLNNFLYHTRIECMVIGGLGAVVVHRYPRLLRVVQHRAVGAVVLLAAALIAVVPDIFAFSIVATSAIFALLIVHIATATRPILRVENRVTAALGNVSYGVYMIHPLVLYLLWTALQPLRSEGSLYPVVLYGGTIGIALAVSFASYRWLETPFLRLKSRLQPNTNPVMPQEPEPSPV